MPFDPNSQQNIALQLKGLKTVDEVTEFLTKLTHDTYAQREKQLGKDIMNQVEKWVGLSVVDNLWMEHLDVIDDLREGIGLRGYGQLDPLVEYKNEAYSMFERLVSSIDYEITRRIFKVQVQLSPDQLQALQQQQTAISKSAKQEREKQSRSSGIHDAVIHSPPAGGSQTASGQQKKLGRNDPCWCGSGKKWKKCHYPQIG